MRAGPLAQPGINGGVFQSLPVIREAQVQPDQAEAELIEAKTQPGEKKSLDNRIERVEFALMVHDGQRAREEHFIRPAEFLDQAEHVFVAGKPVVVELLDGPIPAGLLEAAGQAADIIGRLVDSHIMTCAS